ncbi:DUF3618 domain-containing protein [Microvirga sp. BT325]|uniref:DUF3618 domain-containing protein n=2 Tax=Microvirga splendida TaxID=2795727 RepID=A0ABS0XY29_9HYPH|nr:DUF3618 domain-containing protein [Microvirga splendida]
MTSQNLHELERDIERSRAQLDQTIDRLQDKMTVSGVVDDVLGTARNGQYGPLYDRVLDTVRRNPVPVMLIAMGIGLLAYRLGRPTRPVRQARLIVAEDDLITEEHLLMEVEDPRLYGTEAVPQPATDPMFERPGMNSRY